MEIIIKISDEDYERLKLYKKAPFSSLTSRIYEAVANGIVIPKGHGRLFDEQDIVNGDYKVIGNKIYELEPIIEADKEESEDKE